MLNANTLFWAAGFLEGEGCFQPLRGVGQISAVQKQKEPLERLQDLFGGYVRKIVKHSPERKEGQREYWRWELNGAEARSLMIHLFDLMSPRRREQIQKCMITWTPEDKRRRGEEHHGVRVPDTLVKEIARRYLEENITQGQLSREYHIHQGVISSWLKGMQREALFDAETLAKLRDKACTNRALTPRLVHAKVSYEQAQMLKQLSAEGVSRKSLAVRFSITPEQVGNIIRGKTWRIPPQVLAFARNMVVTAI